MTQAMLAESGVLADMGQYINDQQWWMEQKLDGHRVLVGFEDGRSHFMNRDGNPYGHGVPGAVQAAVNGAPFSGRWVLDGELLDGVYHVFDVLILNGADATGHAFEQRRAVLEKLFQSWDSPCVRLVDTAKTKDEKARLVGLVSNNHGEGVIAKDKTANYKRGRSRAMRKLKFEQTIDLIVTEVGRRGKEAAGLSIMHDGRLIEVGACSLLGKGPVEVGDVVEVKYLYLGADDRIVQPRLVRRRLDKAPEECTGYELKPVNKGVVSL